ncbi:hypothetical protein T12_4750 [Trichinella patagoniensis]|uniref:Uncharacterized protein n=1 Tax=Trichinella patagoniensis TaxID=990121 RepID=A0A0V0Z9A5_9BILA|nr:hypothetical protein T12_4750 [Trichinella patagoniensis]
MTSEVAFSAQGTRLRCLLIYLLLPNYSRNSSTAPKSCFALSRSPCFVTCVNRNHERKYQSPEAVNEILKNMYVDDLAFSIHEEEGF